MTTKTSDLHATAKFDVSEIVKVIADYYSQQQDGKYHRFLSWEHCYAQFQQAFQDKVRSSDPKRVDRLALHLFAYLASWGMLRNSHLLEHDYRYHIPVVKAILDFAQEHSELQGCHCEKLRSNENINLILDLGDKLSMCYTKIDKGDKPSDTRISKILLGTLGCTIAFDRNAKKGLSQLTQGSAAFDKQSLLCLCDIFEQIKRHITDIAQYDIKPTEGGAPIRYPDMKLLDMALWQLGKEANDREKAAKRNGSGQPT